MLGIERFRQFTAKQADNVGTTGFVRNASDGSVGLSFL